MAHTPSPQLNRLDRILELVTDHEANYREQDIKLSEVTQKMAELEMRMTQELAPLWALKERNIPQELDLARTAVETVVRQLTAVTKTNQLLQSELKACQQRQQQQAAQFESAIALLQGDVAALRGRLDDAQQHMRSAVEQLRSSTVLQLERQAQETEEQLQSLQRESASKLDLLRQDFEAKSSSSVHQLESWAKAELLSLTSKVKAVLTGCAAHQQQVNLQMEALQQQWDNTSSAMEGLAAEDKRLKKHLARLQNQTEELQRLSQQAISSEVALQQMRNDVQQLNTGQQQLATRLEVSSSSLRQKAEEAEQQLAALSTSLAVQNTDLARFAESVGACLAAAREDAAAAASAAAAAAPSSYLSTLLAPAGAGAAAAAAAAAAGSSGGGGIGFMQLPGVQAGAAGGLVVPARRQTWAAWDRQLAEFDDLVGRLRRRLQAQQAADFQGGSSSCCGGMLQPGTLAGIGSPVRRAVTSAGGGAAGKYQLQQSSPGGLPGGHLLKH